MRRTPNVRKVLAKFSTKRNKQNVTSGPVETADEARDNIPSGSTPRQKAKTYRGTRKELENLLDGSFIWWQISFDDELSSGVARASLSWARKKDLRKTDEKFREILRWWCTMC